MAANAGNNFEIGANFTDDCCLDLINLKDDIEALRKILKEEEQINQQLEQVQLRLDNYYRLPGQQLSVHDGFDEGSREFEEKIYSSTFDEQTKILVTTQQRQMAGPEGKGSGGADEEDADEEKNGRAGGPMSVSVILRSIPTVFQKMSKKTQSDLSNPIN